MDQARSSLDEIGYDLLWAENRYWVVRERGQLRGWGFFVIDTKAKGRLLVEVPAPMDEPSTFASGTRLFHLLEARSLAVFGASRASAGNDPMTSSRTLMARFHQLAGSAGTLQVRGREGQRIPVLRVKRELPDDLHLARIEARTGPLNTLWTLGREPNHLADLSHTAFAELNLPNAFALGSDGKEGGAKRYVPARLDAPLAQHLDGLKPKVAQVGPEQYQRPQLPELLYFDEEILTPLLEARGSLDPSLSEGQATLSSLGSAAAVVGYGIRLLEDPASGTRHLLLEEEANGRRNWGTYVFRLGPASPLAVQVPRPGLDTGSLEFGVWLYEQMRGQALLVAGALPMATRDRASDVNRLGPHGNLFSLATQVILRETAEPGLVVQVRGLSPRASLPALRAPGVDLLLAHRSVGHVEGPLSAFQGLLDRSGFKTRTTRELQESPELGAEWLPASRYLPATSDKAVVLAWLTPDLKRDFRTLDEDRALLRQLVAQRIPTRREDIRQRLAGAKQEPLPTAFLSALETYLQRRDVVLLAQIQSQWPGYNLQCWVDSTSGRAYLVAGREGRPDALASFGATGGPWHPLPSGRSSAALHNLMATRAVRLAQVAP